MHVEQCASEAVSLHGRHGWERLGGVLRDGLLAPWSMYINIRYKPAGCASCYGCWPALTTAADSVLERCAQDSLFTLKIKRTTCHPCQVRMCGPFYDILFLLYTFFFVRLGRTKLRDCVCGSWCYFHPTCSVPNMRLAKIQSVALKGLVHEGSRFLTS